MKKVIIWTVSVLAVLAIAYLGFTCWFGARVKDELAKLRPEDTKKIGAMYCIRDQHANMFAFRTSAGYIAFDAGITDDGIEKELVSLGIEPDSVVRVFLTHTDHDHAGGLDLFDNAQVYISDAEKQMVDGTTSRAPLMHNSIPEGYKTMADGETVTVGDTKVRGVLAPGHTPGSMCFVVNDSILISGDAFSLQGGKASNFNELFTMDMPTHLESIKKLSALQGIKHIYTAHYGFSDDFNSVFSK